MSKEIALPAGQARLLQHLLEGHRAKDAAVLAGMPHKYALDVMLTPRFQAAMHRAVTALLLNEGAPVAYEFLVKTVKGAEGFAAPMSVRKDCAKILLNTTFAPPKATEGQTGALPEPSAMTTEELRRFVDAGERELGNRAVPVDDPAPGIFE